MKPGSLAFLLVSLAMSALVACESLAPTAPANANSPEGNVAAAQTAPPPPAPQATPGVAWAAFKRNACEWSSVGEDPGFCFGTRGEGYRVRVVRLEGTRWLVWDPSTTGVGYVDRDALDVPQSVLDPSMSQQPAPKTVAVCIDRSRSYRDTGRALSALADWIQTSAHPSDVYYLRWIEDNSYRPEAEAMPAIRVPAVPTVNLPATPAPPAGGGDPSAVNPFSRLQKAEATATAQAESRLATATAQAVQGQIVQLSNAYRAAVDASNAYVTQQSRKLAALKPAPAESGDVAGCAQKSAELLAGAPGERYLVIASDLDQDPGHPLDFRLDGIRVRLPYFQCDNPAKCEDVTRVWKELITRAGAIDVRFLDPSKGFYEVER